MRQALYTYIYIYIYIYIKQLFYPAFLVSIQNVAAVVVDSLKTVKNL